MDNLECRARVCIEVVHQPEVTAIGRIDMKAEVVRVLQVEDRRQWIHRPRAGRSERGDDRADTAVAQQALQRVHVHTPALIGRNTREVESEHLGDAAVRVMRLVGCND